MAFTALMMRGGVDKCGARQNFPPSLPLNPLCRVKSNLDNTTVVRSAKSLRYSTYCYNFADILTFTYALRTISWGEMLKLQKLGDLYGIRSHGT